MSWDALKADTHRQFGKFSWANLLAGLMLRRTFRVVVTMRLCQIANSKRALFRPILLLTKILHRCTTHWASIDLNWNTHIGSGIALTHGWGIVVSSRVVIGNNVTIFNGVTLGSRDRINRDGKRCTEYPIIEDNVWIGPHAIIVGGITIGNGSRIAGGAFVMQSIPPFSVVLGNPAVIVKRNCVPDVVNPASIT